MGMICLWQIVLQMKLELVLIYVRYIGRRACTTITKVDLFYMSKIKFIKFSPNGTGVRALCRSWHVFKLCYLLRVNQ